jgi:fibronectin-binding autotransporter adhesin
MKNRRPLISSRASRKLAGSSIVLACSLLTPSAFAVDYTWNNSGTDFATDGNWTTAGFPSDSLTADKAVFAAATTAIPLIAGDRSITGIDFQTNGGAELASAANAILTLGTGGIDATTQISGANTVSVANLKIGAAQTWTLFSNTASSATNSTFSMSSNIDLNGQNLTVTPNRNSTGSNGSVNLSGTISGSVGTRLRLAGTSAFRNTLNLTGANTHTGKTDIHSLTVTANSLADSGTCALGFGDLVLGDTGTTAGVVLTFQNLAADGSTSRLVTTSARTTVTLRNNDADNTVAFTNPGNLDTGVSSSSNWTFNLDGTNTGNNTFGQIINERLGTGVTNFTKSGAGKWVLTGTNTYEGLTTIAGTLQVASIGAGGVPGNMGAASNEAAKLVISSTGILRYTGAGESTDRLFTLNHNAAGANMALDASGDGAIAFTNPGTIAQGATADVTRTLKLTGTNMGDNSIANIIGDNGMGAVSILKSGIGKWTVTGVNSHTGGTTIDNGTLTLTGDQSAANGGWLLRGYGDSGTSQGVAATIVNFETGSTIAVASGKTVTIGGTGGTFPQRLTNKGAATNDGALLMRRAAFLNIEDGASWTQSGSMTLSGRFGFGANLTVKSGGTFHHTGASTVKLFTNGDGNEYWTQLNIDGTGVFNTGTGFEDDNSAGTSRVRKSISLTNGGTLKLTAGVTALTNQVQFALGTGGGVIHTNGFDTTLSGVVTGTAYTVTTATTIMTYATDGSSTTVPNSTPDPVGTTIQTNGYGQGSVGVTGIGGLTKDGVGTLTLSGVNSYAGDTTVSAGTLSLGNTNAGNDASTVTIATTGAILNLTYGGTDTVERLSIGATEMDPGVYGKSGSVLPVIGIPQITGDGTLTVTGSVSGFSVWINGTFANGTVAPGQQGPNADPDGDGVSNLVEYAIAGLDPTVANGSAGTLSGNTLSFTKRLPLASDITYAIEQSTDLGIADVWAEVPVGPPYVNDGTTISYTLPGGPAKDFQRLKVTQP